MVRWGIIGGGNIAHRFAESLKHVEEGELIAVSCRSVEKAEVFSTEYPCRYIYGDGGYQLLENPEVDAVYIGLPHGLHCEWAVRAMEAGKAVLCEKPSVLNRSEMVRVSQVSRETGMLFMEAMKTRFVPAHRLIMEMLEREVVGQISRVETSLCNKSEQRAPDRYLYDPVQGGILLDCGIYCASWIDELTSGKYDTLELRHSTFRMMDQVESYAKSWILYKDEKNQKELRVMLECAFDEKKPRKLTVYGERGTIEVPELHRPQKMAVTIRISGNDKAVENYLDSSLALWEGDSILSEEGKKKTYIFELPYEVDDFYGQILHFTQCLESGCSESPIMPLDASLRCIGLIEMIRERRPDKSFHGISIQYDDRIVRVRTDKALMDFLGLEGNNSLELADHILKTYKSRWGKELKISRESLSVEILIHAYVDIVLHRIDRIMAKTGRPGRELNKKLAFFTNATEIIDCGEKEVDNNRFVFDDLVPFRKVLYLILGDKA